LSVVGIQSALDSYNIRSPESWRRCNQATIILPALESGHRQTKFRLEYCQIPAKPAGSGRIRKIPAGSGQNGRDLAGYDMIRPLIRSNFLAGIRQRRPDVTGFRRHLPNSDFCISQFFRANQTPKNIFEKIIFF